MMTHEASVWVRANIDEVDHAGLSEQLHKARSFTLIHIRKGPQYGCLPMSKRWIMPSQPKSCTGLVLPH